jgi:hypothetical protein
VVVLTDLIQRVPSIKFNTSGLNSRDSSELEMSYSHWWDSQRLLSWEQLKCSSAHRRGTSHVIVTLPVVNQITKRAAISCCDKCVVRSNCKRAFFYENYADMHYVTPLLLSKNIGRQRYLRRDPQQTCAHWFSPKPAKKGSFPCANRRAERHVQRNVEKMKTLLTSYNEIYALLHEEFLPASVCRA